jgi:hypothetical protein
MKLQRKQIFDMSRIIITSLSMLLTFFSFTQEQIGTMPNIENELELLLTSLRKAENNQEKSTRNTLFKDKLFEALEHEQAMHYPFKKLTTVGVISSPDNLVRIFNWNVEQDDFSQKYYCFILRYDDRKKEYQRIELKEYNDVMALKPMEILDSKQWYGALYYQIIPFEKGNKDMYTLLGWDGNSSSSNMKLIDVLYFSGNNAKLGSPVFKVGKETYKRIFYEYSKKSTMSLRWDDKYQRILMDHLSPESPGLAGFYAYYVPDMSYDAFELKSGKWYLKEDVIAINAKRSEKIEIKAPDTEGNLIDIKMKNKWIDPSDSGSPTGGNGHSAALPEEIQSKVEKTKKQNTKVKKSKDNRDPNTSYPYSDLKKMKKKRKKN